MIRQMLLTALMSSAVASSVPLNAAGVDSFQNAYNLGSYDEWLDIPDMNYEAYVYGNDFQTISIHGDFRYHIVYDLYSNTKTPTSSSYDNFYIKLYTCLLEMNSTYCYYNDEDMLFYNNLPDDYDSSYAWNNGRTIDYYKFLQSKYDMANTLFSYNDLMYITDIDIIFGNDSWIYLFDVKCHNYIDVDPLRTINHRIERVDYEPYNDDEFFFYKRGNYITSEQRNICTSTTLVNKWYEILDTTITSAEKITASYNDGYSNGYSNGYTKGYQDADNQDTVVTTIFNGIFGIALLPLNMFLTMLNFEVMGINISGIVTALLTVAMVLIIIKFITGKKVSSGGDE